MKTRRSPQFTGRWSWGYIPRYRRYGGVTTEELLSKAIQDRRIILAISLANVRGSSFWA